MTIGESITRLRKEEGLSGIALAELLGVSGACITMYENGKRTPNIKMLQRIAKVCNRTFNLKIHPEDMDSIFTFRESVRVKSFDKKIQECWQPLFNYCMKFLCRNQSDAKDLVQETMLTALKMHYSLRADVAIMTWLIGIAKKKALARKSKLVLVETYIETDKLTDEIEDYFRANVDIWKFIANLTDRKRKIYELAMIGLEYKEIAYQLNTTENAIKTTMGQIRGQLKKMIV